MRKLFGWSLSWICFWLGDAVYLYVLRIWDHWDIERFHPYPIYNWFMTASFVLQDWSGVQGPWYGADEEVRHEPVKLLFQRIAVCVVFWAFFLALTAPVIFRGVRQ